METETPEQIIGGRVKWPSWTWKDYQVSIVRQNHHISKTTAAAEALAEVLQTICERELSGDEAWEVASPVLAQWEEAKK